MSTDQPPSGSPDDPFAKRPREDGGAGPPGGGPPYDRPANNHPSDHPPNQPPPGRPYGGGPHGAPPPGGPDQGGPFGGGPYGPGRGPYAGDPYGGAPPPFEGMPPLADGGKRVLARIIDIILVLIPAGLLDWAAGGIDRNGFDSGRSAIGGVLTAGIGFLYEWLMTRSDGQTLGKKAMRIRTAMLEDGSVPTSSAAAVRAVLLWLPAFLCSLLWFVIIGITVLYDRRFKQGLHDRAAKTVVVQVD